MQFSDTKKCPNCKRDFLRETTGSKRCCPKAWKRRIFCSVKCRAQAFDFTKSNNPHWKGGVSECVDCKKQLSQRYKENHTKRCRECSSKARRGSKHHNWRGGITPLRTKMYNSSLYSIWRNSVFERDNYRCVMCSDERGKNLQADHIYPFAMYPEHAFDTNNGRTLCKDCHKNTATYGYGTVKLIKQYGI